MFLNSSLPHVYLLALSIKTTWLLSQGKTLRMWWHIGTSSQAALKSGSSKLNLRGLLGDRSRNRKIVMFPSISINSESEQMARSHS